MHSDCFLRAFRSMAQAARISALVSRPFLPFPPSLFRCEHGWRESRDPFGRMLTQR